ncbi:major facilitator superfamily domain-containing protein [Lyophyllum atratum]|nr:major facilitator superfamily domain-containing protein [Lyophyllum atratum]
MSTRPDTQLDILDPGAEEEVLDVEAVAEILASQETTFPEGGWKAWSVVLGVSLNQFATLGYINAHGVYNDFYVREYLTQYSSSQISWIASVQLLFVISSGIFTGRAFDVGYFYHLMIGGSVLFVVSLFMLSLTHAEQYYQVFLTQGLGVGIASGMTYIPGLAVIAHYFRRRRALAMGIATSGSAVGAALHPIMLNRLFHGSVGFHNGVRSSAGMNLGLLAIALLLMKPRLPACSRKQGSTLQNLKTFLREPSYVSTIAGIFLILAGLYFPIFFLQLNAIRNGLTPGFAFYTAGRL